MKGLRLFYVFTHRCLHLRFPSEIWLCSVVENRMSSIIFFMVENLVVGCGRSEKCDKIGGRTICTRDANQSKYVQ